MFALLGLNVENYLGEVLECHDHKFVSTTQELTKYNFYVQNRKTCELFVLQLWMDNSQTCPSGWSISSLGCFELKEVQRVQEFDFFPKSEHPLDLSFFKGGYQYKTEVKNTYFQFSVDGGDSYYPSGYLRVFWDQFC